MGLFKKKEDKFSAVTWDMSTKEARERQVVRDFEIAKTHKSVITEKFRTLDDYYNNKHYTREQILKVAEQKGWNFIPPVLPDPFIQVESQIDPDVPVPEFKGRDDDIDSLKAKQREEVVNYICYNNKIDDMNTTNERRLNKLGDAFWKVSFDGSIQGLGYVGDIVIGNPDPANIFPDPSAYDIDDCEYFIYPFRMHRRAARRMFGRIVDSIQSDNNHGDTEIYNNSWSESTINTLDDNTLQVVEYWYKDDNGDIACSININGTEVKHIPKYWINTASSGNKMYPFIQYCKIPVDKSFWNKGEIETIIDLVDSADREFLSAIMNDMFNANDITLVEERALADGEVLSGVPGQTVKVKEGKINGVRRLGGLNNNINSLNMIQFIHDKIMETNGNFDSAQGKEPLRVTTSSGIAQLNERANARKEIKKADRKTGFRRLYELIDWTALEFYNTDRLILIRGKGDEPDTTTTFNSDRLKTLDETKAEQIYQRAQIKGLSEEEALELIKTNAFYYPKVDIEISVGEGVRHSKAFTLAATEQLAKTEINPINKEIIKSQIDIMDLPNKQAIKDSIDQALQPQQPQQAAADKPNLAINFKDLPPDGKIQLAAQAGIQLSGIPESEIPEQQDQQSIIDEAISQLSPEELQTLENDPALMEEFVNSIMGGTPNGTV
jgi:hypothetical protein